MGKSHAAGRGSEQPTFAQLRELLAQIEKGRVTRDRMQEFLRGSAQPVTVEMAREIMGTNFFGIEEAIKHFGVNPIDQQRVALQKIPFSKEVLEQLRDTHILVAVFPLSIVEIRGKVKAEGLFWDQSWYENQPFAKEGGRTSWQLILKTPVPDSVSKTWDEQLALLGEDSKVPTAQVMVYAIIGHFLVTGKRLFEDAYIRTLSVDSVGVRVAVGHFGLEGLCVNYYWDGDRFDYLGVSSARKLES